MFEIDAHLWKQSVRKTSFDQLLVARRRINLHVRKLFFAFSAVMFCDVVSPQKLRFAAVSVASWIPAAMTTTSLAMAPIARNGSMTE
jgi:hypothetical protein